jgi:ABC-type branched-subunit amino acid transport system ATPase component
MIQTVHIRNYKSLQDVRVELERFTVFVGANGTGKTSVLEAIHNAVRAATGDPQKVFAHDRHGDWIYTKGGTGDLSIRCQAAGRTFGVEATQPKEYRQSPELMQKESRWEYRISPPGEALAAALEPARSVVFMRPNAAVMARPSYSQDDPPRVTSTGRGLASVLAYMALNNPQGFEDLVAVARTLIPRLRRIRFRKATVYRTESELVKFGKDTVNRSSRRPYQGELVLLDFQHAENISAGTASEGTMLMRGLLTVLLGPTRPRILLLDDIEHALHPLAQKQLVEAIGQILQKYPDLQLLATAHSPYLLNYLAPEQVRIMAAGADSYARCGRLSDHPKFATWKEEMAPGEMWSLFGDKWLADTGAPT